MDINSICQSENLRLYIIEHTLILEELVSETLGRILNIDYENSLSFGFGSVALSFNQKVQLISDIKTLTSQERQKMKRIMEIRNKFAHVKRIETFEQLFKLSSGKDIKKDLENWYSIMIPKGEEKDYKYHFFLLFKEIGEIIWTITVNHVTVNAKTHANASFTTTYLKYLEQELAQNEEGNDIKDRALQKTKHELQT